MKVKNLCLLAGATAALAFSGSALAGDSGLVFEWESTGSGALGLTYEGSVNGDLATIVISVTGVPAGAGTVGVLNTPNTPFLMYTGDGSLFFNQSWAPFPEGATVNPFAPDTDSGFIGLAGWGTPSNNMQSWATTGQNITEFGGAPGFWISLEPTGEPSPGGDIAIYQVSWNANTSAHGAFNFAVVDPMAGEPSDEFYFTWTAAVPAPGALALLGLAGLVGARRRRA